MFTSITNILTCFRLSGFQLFLQNQRENGGDNGENIVPKAMSQWKELSAEDRKQWNEKAQGQNDCAKSNNILTSKEDNNKYDGDNANNKDNDKISELKKINNLKIAKENKASELKKTHGKLKDKDSKPDGQKISEVKTASRQKLAAFSFQQK